MRRPFLSHPRWSKYHTGMENRAPLCRWLFLAAAQGLVLLFATAAPAQEPATPADYPQLTLLDGKPLPATGLELADGVFRAAGLPAGLTLDDLRAITVKSPASSPATEKPVVVVVDLVGGGSVAAQQVTIADDQCTIRWSLGEPLKVPIDALRAIRFQPTVANEEFNKSLAAPAADVDRLFVNIDGKIDSITGLVTGLTDAELAIEVDGQVRTLPRDRVFGIVVALAAPETRLPRCTFHLADGSVLGGDFVSLAGGKAQIQVAGNSRVEVPWDAVSRIVVRSSRVVYLSDLKPVDFKQQVIVTLRRPWQRDKCVTGKPLTLGGRTFEKGIGLQSQAELTFDIPGEYDVLAATIGIDDDTGDKGDCIFEVVVDGQRLFSQRVRGTDPPQDIQVPVARGKRVSLVVLPGEDLDLADHADWADVRLLKNKP